MRFETEICKFKNGSSKITYPHLTNEEWEEKYEKLKKATAGFLVQAERDRRNLVEKNFSSF